MYTERLGWPTRALVTLFIMLTLMPVVVFGSCTAVMGRSDSGSGMSPTDLIALALVLLIWAGVVTGLNGILGQLVVTIDDSAVTLKVGLRQRRVPLNEIATCGPTSYHWWTWGGWGVRLNPLRRTVIANVPGDKGRTVQLVLHDGYRVLFSARDPMAMCERIRERNPSITIISG